MLSFNKNFRRRVSRDMADDLSIVKGIPPVRHITTFRKQARRVRKYPSDMNLLQHFLTAREKVIPSVKKNSAANSACTANPIAENGCAMPFTTSKYFRNEKGSLTSYQYQQHPTINGGTGMQGLGKVSGRPVTLLSSTPSSAKAVSRVRRELFTTPLQPVSQNLQYGGGGARMGSEVQYWASLSQKKNGSRSNEYTAGVASASDWAVSSGPITRNDAYNIQQEMASSLTGSSSSSSTSGGFFSSRTPISSIFTPEPQRIPTGADGYFLVPPTPMPSLLRSIQPPSLTPLGNLQNLSINQPWTPDQHRGVVQGEWISRDNLKSSAITKQFSIAQLIDILTGDAVPPTSEIAGHVFHPAETVNNAADFRNFVTPIPAANVAETEKPTSPVKSTHKKRGNKRKRTDSRPLHEINRSWFPMEDEDDDGEQSVYFKNIDTPARNTSSSSKQKSVSFLTDGEDNVAVQTFFFETPTQEGLSCSGTAFFDLDKENQMGPPEMFSITHDPSPLHEFLQPPPTLPPPTSLLGSVQTSELFFSKPCPQNLFQSSLDPILGPEIFLSSIGNDMGYEVVMDSQATFNY